MFSTISEDRLFLELDKEYNEKQNERLFQSNEKYCIFQHQNTENFQRNFGRFKQFASEIRDHLPRYLSDWIPSKVRSVTGPGLLLKSGRIPDWT